MSVYTDVYKRFWSVATSECMAMVKECVTRPRSVGQVGQCPWSSQETPPALTLRPINPGNTASVKAFMTLMGE